MAVFEYRALNAKGSTTKGIVDAENLRAARVKLRQQGVFPTALNETNRETTGPKSWNVNIDLSRKRVNLNELAVSTRQLSTLVGAGMPLVDSLRALGDQVDHKPFRSIISEIADLLSEGSSFADAIRKYPKIFPRLYANMVASGEVSGTLDMVLARLADLLENQAALRRKVTSALTYPILMMFLCIGVVILLMAYVVPQITQIFKDQGVTLPLPTRIVIGTSEFVQGYWPLVLGMVFGAVFLVRRWSQTPEGRKRLHSLILRTPIFGTMVLKVATARLARNLGTMLQSGIEVLSALNIAKNIVGNVVLEEAIEKAAIGVREGRSLAKELRTSAVFPSLLIHMVAIGERTGQLDSLLLRSADAYENEVNSFLSGLTAILEPIMIIFLAVIVGGILAAVMLPMLEMTNLSAGS